MRPWRPEPCRVASTDCSSLRTNREGAEARQRNRAFPAKDAGYRYSRPRALLAARPNKEGV
jgi:hypothetical protein